MVFYMLISSVTWNMCLSAEICSRQYREETLDRIFYYKKFFCCGNYEDHNGQCEPCPIGFTSAAESTCVPCPKNTFGIKCSEYCNCKLDQRCDIEIGCVKVEQQTAITSNYTTSVRGKITGHKTVIIIVGITSFFIFVFICVLVVYCIRRKLQPRKIFHIIPNNSFGQQDNSGHRSSTNNETEDDDNAYAEIDEEGMCPDSPISRIDKSNSNSKSSSSSKDSRESVSDGYINPYQALLSDSKMKLSSEVVFEQEDREEQQRNYSKLENNGISEQKENTNDNPEKVIYLELEDINTAEIMPVMESENGDRKEDNTKHHVEWTFKRLNTM